MSVAQAVPITIHDSRAGPMPIIFLYLRKLHLASFFIPKSGKHEQSKGSAVQSQQEVLL